MDGFFTYIVRCADGTLYTGWTTNLTRRMAAHNCGKNGARYTKSRRPVTLVYAERRISKQDAMRRECEIKQMTRKEKMLLMGFRDGE